jgi:hypothetical protein
MKNKNENQSVTFEASISQIVHVVSMLAVPMMEGS